MDVIDRTLLELLQDDARTSYAELGRHVGLTPPAVAERVRRLENSGVIEGYRAQVNLKRAGYGLIAFIQLSSPPELAKQLGRIATETPEVLEFHHMTGSAGFLLKVAARSIEHLEKIINLLLPYGQTQTSVVLSSPVTWRKIEFDESV
ncbi:MAG TPA: Lrp/AsnC family transcriptional regulator [Coriobacteriia bacterium]|nr:Lrp/AsnC family transcriptional regulator [Coriobacteriia bacterium]